MRFLRKSASRFGVNNFSNAYFIFIVGMSVNTLCLKIYVYACGKLHYIQIYLMYYIVSTISHILSIDFWLFPILTDHANNVQSNKWSFFYINTCFIYKKTKTYISHKLKIWTLFILRLFILAEFYTC